MASFIDYYRQGQADKQERNDRAGQKRFGEIIGQMGAATDRAPLFQEAAAINPQGAMQAQQYYQQQDANAAAQKSQADKQAALLSYRKVQALRTAPPELKVKLYAQHAPESYQQTVQFLGREPTPQEMDAFIDQNIAELSARAGVEPPKQDLVSAETRYKTEASQKEAETRLKSDEARRDEERRFNAEQKRLDREVQIRGQDLGSRRSADAASASQAASQNQRTWETYKSAMDALRGSMAATTTGALSGRMPAFTSEQQTAEGAVAAMAPILKQIFRTAGEGTFTDKDQELLMRMVPTRTDSSQAREAKIVNIDNIIKSKLGLGSAPTAQGTAPEQTATGPDGQKIVLRNGQWVPL